VKLFGNVILRIVAVFAASGLGVIGAGAIAGIPILQAITVAGLTAVAVVVEKLARGFMDNGKLSMDEIDAAFDAVDASSRTVSDVKLEERRAVDKKLSTVKKNTASKLDGQIPKERPVDEDWNK
jgi:hypothetical protein